MHSWESQPNIQQSDISTIGMTHALGIHTFTTKNTGSRGRQENIEYMVEPQARGGGRVEVGTKIVENEPQRQRSGE